MIGEVAQRQRNVSMNNVANLNLAGDNIRGICPVTGGVDTPVASAQEVNSVARDRSRADGGVVRDGWGGQVVVAVER